MQLLPVLLPRQAPFHLLIDETRDVYIAPTLARYRLWEPAETALFLRLLRPGDRVVDVGAHVGYFTVLFSRLCGAGGFVHAFEPEPANYRLLRANLLVNDCRNVEALELAASDAAGTEGLFLSPCNGGDHRLSFEEGRARCEVRTTRLDEALGEQRVDFVKIDAQGAEPRILQGMRGLVARERARVGVLAEFAPGLLERHADGLAGFAELLGTLGARAFHPREAGGNLAVEPVPLPAGLQPIADALSARGEEDASTNLLLFFSDAAQRRHLERLALS